MGEVLRSGNGLRWVASLRDAEVALECSLPQLSFLWDWKNAEERKRAHRGKENLEILVSGIEVLALIRSCSHWFALLALAGSHLLACSLD